MHRQIVAAGLAVAVATVALAAPATAPSGTASHKKSRAVISERVARDIAWSSGLVHVEEIALFGKAWEIAGRDRQGNEQTLDIDAYDGRVLD